MRSSLWDAFVIAIWVEKYLSVIHKKFNYHFLINKVRLYAFISLSISILLFLPGFTATYRSKNDLDLQIKKVIEKVSTQNLQATITHLQSYGNRTTNEKQREAALWVREEFKKLGLKNDLHEYEFDVVLDDCVRLIRFTQEFRPVGHFKSSVRNLVPNYRIQV